jgi:hypothetical protein
MGKELVYYSPCSQEATPSFMVDPTKNVFHDFSGEGQRGDIIRLVQYLTRCSFLQAVSTLEAFSGQQPTPSFFLSGLTTPTESEKRANVVRTQSIRNRALITYLNSRSISLAVATGYLHEVYYQINGRNYFALGFRNDKGGYELRSEHFKGSTTPKWFSSLVGQNTGIVNVFEGVFDMLSCCEQFKTVQLRNPTIVLNSLTFLNETLPILADYRQVNAFFDNDGAGKRALTRLQQTGLTVQDCSTYYATCKDYNEYHLQHHKGYHLGGH